MSAAKRSARARRSSRGPRPVRAKRSRTTSRRKPVRAKRSGSARGRKSVRSKKSGAAKRTRRAGVAKRLHPASPRRSTRTKTRRSAARRRTSRPAAPPAFPQRTSASGKQLVLFELLRARAAVLAAIQGLPPSSAEQPLADGKWNAREVVLHLVARDRVRLREMEAALRGVRASWADVRDEEMNLINQTDLATLRHLDWEAARRLLHTTRHQLMEAVESVPEDPVEVWGPEHPFGWMLHRLPPHDRHHAEDIKRWRAAHGV